MLFPAATDTRTFNTDPSNVSLGRQRCETTTLSDWFDGSPEIELDEEIVGLGGYGFTLTVFTSEALPDEPDEEEDEEAQLIESYTPKFARGR